MGVVQYKLDSAGASGSSKGRTPGSVLTSYRANFTVEVSAAADGPETVLDYFRATSTLPWIGRSFKYGNDSDSSAICVDVDAERIPMSNWFRVVAMFEPREGGPFEGSQADVQTLELQTDPLRWHDEIEVLTSQVSAPLEYAEFAGFNRPIAGKPWHAFGKLGPPRNSAGDIFDPPAEHERDIDIVRITYSEYPYDQRGFRRFRGTVNADDVVINKAQYGFFYFIPATTGKWKGLATQFQIINKRKFYRTTIEIHVDPKGWRFPFVDRGLHRLKAAGEPDGLGGTIDGQQINPGMAFVGPPEDIDGIVESGIVNLDGRGLPLDPKVDPVYLIYKGYVERPWSGVRW